MNKALFFLLILMAHGGWAQELIPMGEWRNHFNFQQTHRVEVVNQKIFTSTANSIMILDLNTDALTSLSRLDGLTEVGTSALAFDVANQRLVVGYENGNLDLISGNDIHNNPVLLKSPITDDKQITDISFYQGTINLSTGFGVLVVDPNTDEVKESYRNLGENGEKISVKNSTFMNDIMFLATSQGVLSGDRASGDNLQDFNNWERYDGSVVYGQDMVSVAVFEASVYAAKSDALFQLTDQNWVAIPDFLETGETIQRLRLGSGALLIVTNLGAYQLKGGLISKIPIPAETLPTDMVEYAPGEYYLASPKEGLIKLVEGNSHSYLINGPNPSIYRLKFESGVVFAFPSLDLGISSPASNDRGISQFIGGVWENVELGIDGFFDNVSDEVTLGETQFFGSFGQGVLDAMNGIVYDESNSTLQEHSANVGNILVSGVGKDQVGNLWVSAMSPNPLHKMDTEGNWSQFSFGSGISQEPTFLRVHPDGSLWMALGLNTGAGVMAYDPNLDVQRYISATNTSLPDKRVNDIAIDLESEIWFATDRGVAYFPFSYGVIGDPTIDVIKPVFEDAYLFENKKITCIEVDAGNRKWMGSEEGVWLLEDHGNQLVHHFDMGNSPLPSNNILDLAIHQTTGEVFISTDRGLVSFRSDATTGSSTHQNVKIFPNPVLPGYNGQVGFDGLARDATLKIATVSGRLVRQILAVGSGASWNLADYNGRRVDTGVYLVFSSNADGSETYVGKIAVIK